MRLTFLCSVALFVLMLSVGSAFALTIDKDSGMNSDGSAKFSDPDERRPGYLNGGPDDPNTSNYPSPSYRTPNNISPGIMGSDSRGPYNPYNSGPDAFDQAYSHK